MSRVVKLIVDEMPIDHYGRRVLNVLNDEWRRTSGGLFLPASAVAARYRVIHVVGGEPMAFPATTVEILKTLRHARRDVKIKLWTGFADTEALLKAARWCDAVAVTLTSFDDEHHFRVARLGFRDFGNTVMEVRYDTTTGEDPAGRVFERYWRMTDMAHEGDYLTAGGTDVVKLANPKLF